MCDCECDCEADYAEDLRRCSVVAFKGNRSEYGGCTSCFDGPHWTVFVIRTRCGEMRLCPRCAAELRMQLEGKPRRKKKARK